MNPVLILQGYLKRPTSRIRTCPREFSVRSFWFDPSKEFILVDEARPPDPVPMTLSRNVNIFSYAGARSKANGRVLKRRIVRFCEQADRPVGERAGRIPGTERTRQSCERQVTSHVNKIPAPPCDAASRHVFRLRHLVRLEVLASKAIGGFRAP